MEKVLHFLLELADHNNREWFDQNRQWYEESRGKMLFTTEILINEIKKFDSAVSFTNAKECMFRIYRDVRFSEDKRPYKHHFGSFIANNGRKSEGPGYYIHVEPGKTFVGGGIYRPSASFLKAIRTYIDANGHEVEQVLNDEAFKLALPEKFEDVLKTAPKGYSVDHPFIELLRYKSFAFSAHITDESLINGDFIEETLYKYKQLQRLNVLLYQALADL